MPDRVIGGLYLLPVRVAIAIRMAQMGYEEKRHMVPVKTSSDCIGRRVILVRYCK
ncbi:hypothetical protein [Rivularia sp. UHCC 0363]|uniref:hypothetical protein n=1 Tax=Rivularia sp. UHCC 0363 TaxID=3110244 RepID=UPI002B20B7DB|nr:hypothetical protein [Rivularia sp. UHCC 0363]MEA5592861.1 hypothetical protein [Rivularia sp. UHCC 0363]